MSDPRQPSTPAGWYPDGQGGTRWWDGVRWTEHTQPAQPAQPVQPPAPPVTPQPPASSPYDAPTMLPGTPAAPLGPPPSAPPADQTQLAGGYQPPGPGYPPQGGYGQPPQAPGYPPQGGYGAPQPGWEQLPANPSSGVNGKLIAIIGGAVAVVAIVLVVLFVFVLDGGGSERSAGPQGVAEDFLDAQLAGDIGQACEMGTDNLREQMFAGLTDVDDCDSLQREVDASNDDEGSEDVELTYEVGTVDEDDDTATVEVTETFEYTGDDPEIQEQYEDGGANSYDLTLSLVKVDGDWMVDDIESTD